MLKKSKGQCLWTSRRFIQSQNISPKIINCKRKNSTMIVKKPHRHYLYHMVKVNISSDETWTLWTFWFDALRRCISQGSQRNRPIDYMKKNLVQRLSIRSWLMQLWKLTVQRSAGWVGKRGPRMADGVVWGRKSHVPVGKQLGMKGSFLLGRKSAFLL